MELKFEKDELLKTVQILQGVASSRSTLPILSNILINASEERIEMSATDLEIGIRILVDGEIVAKEGQEEEYRAWMREYVVGQAGEGAWECAGLGETMPIHILKADEQEALLRELGKRYAKGGF